MRGFGFRLLVAFFAFGLGVTATALYLYSRQIFVSTAPVTESSPRSAMATPNRTLVSGMAGEGISEEGYATSFSNHDYSDGTYVHQLSVFYPSPKQANAALRKRLKDAVEIIRREPELDERGVKVGERVVATFAPYKGSTAVSAELLWTEGSRYVSQQRSSVESILEALDADR